MSAIVTNSASTAEMFEGVRVHAGIVVAGSGMAVALAGATVVGLHLIACSERLVIEERGTAFTLYTKEKSNLRLEFK